MLLHKKKISVNLLTKGIDEGQEKETEKIMPHYDTQNGAHIEAQPITEHRQATHKGNTTSSAKHNMPTYNMNHSKRGMAIILNQEYFKNGQRRKGTNVDSENLKCVLEKFYFEVSVFNDLCAWEILAEMKKIASIDHSDSDCILIAILTHGDANEIGAYDKNYKLNSIFDCFAADRCPTLMGKPKIFIVQACRGDKHHEGVILQKTIGRDEQDCSPVSLSIFHRFWVRFSKYCRESRVTKSSNSINLYSNEYILPKYCDFLIAYSTKLGFVSYRNTIKGGPYIQKLCAVFDEFGKYLNILDLLTIVSNQVVVNWEHENKRYKQMPCFESNLTNDFRFSDK